MAEDLAATLIDLERARCRAITNVDIAALKAISSEDFTYTHTGGQTDALATFLTGAAEHPREIMRSGDPQVRFYGDVAVMTGMVHSTFPARDGGTEPIELDSHALQVWVKQDGSWKHAAFAASAQLPDSLRG
jgi:hypothetical protein